MAVQINEEAIAHLSQRIEEGNVTEAPWAEVRPSNDEEIAFIEEHGWNAFARWHLALDTGAGQFSMRRYEYLVGDFENVCREALEATRERAGRLGFGDVAKAAQRLLHRIDGTEPEETESGEKVEESE